MGMRAGLAPISALELDALRQHPESILARSDPTSEQAIDLDKAWHGIHWLLTGDEWAGEEPLSLAIVGGEDIGPDLGYGPARFVTPAQTQAVATALAALTDKELQRRFDPVAMDEHKIYPGIWERDGAEALDYLLPYFRMLARFYADAARRGDGVLQWIS